MFARFVMDLNVALPICILKKEPALNDNVAGRLKLECTQNIHTLSKGVQKGLFV